MLDRNLVGDVLAETLRFGGDYGEFFLEDRYSTRLGLVGGKVETGISGREYGVGIRVFAGYNSVYAYTNQVTRENLLTVARDAAQALNNQNSSDTVRFRHGEFENQHPIRIYPESKDQRYRVELMRTAYHEAKTYNELIEQVRIRFMDEDQKVLIANTDGDFVEDRRVRTRMAIEAIAAKGSEKQSGFYGPGAHMGLEFYDRIDISDYAREAARIAVTMIQADQCPSGRFPVIIDNEFGGVIFHEACGHGLEASSVAKKTSVFADKLGEQIASPLVTAWDDGTIVNAWGSQNVDDEGTPTQRTLLIDKGILRGYMVDKLNGRRMNMHSTGSGRRQSYKFAPTSRMSNTFIDAGESTPEQIIANTEYGLYARYMGGGSVNPATGEFNFAVNEGYMVRNGKIAEPVRGATLIGRGAEVLKQIDMVGNNLALGQGMCGAASGSIPANVGQPMLRVSEMTVGGRKGKGDRHEA
ncbi:MAG: TldD/PmbA family protein [Firmicutes bacterium]|nr:TldD/PmbA family protein [Bacillota bacterium]